MRLVSNTLWAVILASLFPGAAFAGCDMKLSDLGDFEIAALGAPRDLLPADVRRNLKCDEDGDCVFVRDGITYDIDKTAVVRKRIKVGPDSPEPAFPFGLSSSDTIGQVVRKLTARKDAPDDLFIVSNEGVVTVSSGFCLQTKDNDTFELDFTFGGNDLLESVTAEFDPEED